MILPIYTFGSQILRDQTVEIENDSEVLQQLIDDMFETMYNASGVGLAAPQVGRHERLFIVDPKSMLDDDEEDEFVDLPGPLVFINPRIIVHEDLEVEFEEGCLSIPEMREVVVRPDEVEVEYLDRTMKPMRLAASGLLSRVIQHEFDHLNGVLFVDHLSPLKRRLLRRRLREMSRGDVTAEYPICTAPEAERQA